jgi:hypothetical protein
VAILTVPCFRYLGNDLNAPLTIEDGAEADQFVRCPVRERLFRLTPEERVRQALIWFLRDGSERAAVLRERVRLGVEERSLDVAAFFAGSILDDRFRPSVTVSILEAKRQEEELADHVEQLKVYMMRDRCRSGLLFNGRQAGWLRLSGDFANPDWQITWLADLREAEDRMLQSGTEVNAHLTGCRALFTAAATGDFGALVQLVSVFCEDLSLTYSLSVRARGSVGLVQAFSLRVENPILITHRTRGVISRHRQQLTREGFHSLVAMRPLTS